MVSPRKYHNQQRLSLFLQDHSGLYHKLNHLYLDWFGIRCIYKSKPEGRVITNPDIRFFTRHYRSGKADDPTVECTLDSKTPIINQECTAIITMNGMIHPDTVD
jgi:hypothetical protein